MCETKGRLDGKVAVVTGGSSGIGYEAARQLAYRGARVIIASRNEDKLIKARDRIKEDTGNIDVSYRLLDLASLKSVRRFASETVNNEYRLDILVNNAGAVGLPDILTDDGLNLTMQVNFFGAFLLTYLLVPMLKSSAPSRILTGTASSMFIGELDFDHWNNVGRYSSLGSLANSKLADTLFSVELSKRLNPFEVTSNSFDPFVVRGTDITGSIPGFIQNISRFFIDVVGQPAEEVGTQILYLAAEPSLEAVSGAHYKFCKNWFNHWSVYDDDLRGKLWDVTKRLVKVTAEEDWEDFIY